MAGSNSAFSATKFRNAIHFAMNMGLPNAVPEQPIFKWSTQHTYDRNDPTSRPYNWTSTPSTTQSHVDVMVPAAVEFQIRANSGGGDTTVGKFESARAVLTLLDTDFEQIVGADTVLLGGNTYYVDFVEPPVALFEVTVYRVHASARDES